MKRASAKAASLLLTLALLLALAPAGAAAAEEKAGWWTGDAWSVETLQSLGAKPPAYNKAEKRYEIGTPEQFLFLSGAWKTCDVDGDGVPDAPRDGRYVLTADLDMGPLMEKIGAAVTAASGTETAGYMPPFSANKDENADKSDGWFLGVFDGGYHVVSNLSIRRVDGKYAALFGYVGSETDHAVVRNLGLADVSVTGSKTCGAIAGVSYGAIENCLVTGSVQGKETIGGLVGKVKEGRDSHVTNCFVYMDVAGKELVGGLAATIESGGTVDGCYVGGTVKAGDGKVSAGGAAGAFSAGDWLKNTVALQSSIKGGEGARDADRLVGTLESESGANLVNNYVWEGTALTANEPEEHPNLAVAQAVSAKTLLSRQFYSKDLGWKLGADWSWVGPETAGYPVPAGFAKAGSAPDLLTAIVDDLTLTQAALNIDNPAVNRVEQGGKAEITASVALPAGAKVDSVRVFYGGGADGTAFTDFVEMQAANGAYRAVLPLTDPGRYYYYVQAEVGGQKLTKPYDVTGALPLVLDDGAVDGAPREIVCQVGETYAEVGFNWLTDPAVTASTVWYREKGASQWSTASGQSSLHYLTKGWEEVQSHWATVTGLRAETAYEYCVGGAYGGTEFRSPVHTFTTLPAEGAFTFMQYSDMQAEEPEGYTPFLETLENFVDKLPVQPDFLLNTGDIVASGYKSSEWANFFSVAQSQMADRLNILLPGNHENKGDLQYRQYGARTSLPNEEEYGPLEGTGWCVVGDACFVFVNTDPYSGETGADVEADRARFFAEQTAWAKEVYEKADCTWRIMASHVGTYIINFNDPADYPYIPEMCDELQVDLYLNGHDHEYIRTTAKDNAKTGIGAGTTYVTCSSLGEKLDAFEPDTAGGKYAVVHKDGAEESQQIFSMVTVDQNGIHLTAYQRGVEEDWSVYDVIDRFDITTSLTKGAQAQTKTQTPAVPAAAAAEPSAPEPVSPAAEGTYVVLPGDCLYRIAQRLYGDASQWVRLYEENRDLIRDPAWIYIGQVLKVPA